jgi:hypothetical protein
MKPLSSFVLIAGVCATACTIDDADRCVEGYVWNEQFMGCECDVDGGYYLEADENGVYTCEECVDSDTHTDCPHSGDADTDTDADTDADAGGDSGTDTETDVGSGLGTVCGSSTDCAAFEANFCAISPLAPSDPGYCTFENCSAGECPTPYLCCDLSGLGYGIACLNEEDTATATGFGATCD